MVRVLFFTALFGLVCPRVTEAQSEPGHVYVTYRFRAHPESDAAYSQAYWDVLRPIWSQVQRQGGIVSYLDLSKTAGDTGSDTHMVFVEFPDMAAFGNFAQQLDRASQAVFGRPYAEVSAEKFLFVIRIVRRSTRLRPGACSQSQLSACPSPARPAKLPLKATSTCADSP